jgi:hypothetical protein
MLCKSLYEEHQRSIEHRQVNQVRKSPASTHNFSSFA